MDLTEQRILAAAELVFSRDGFQGATTREIAQQAGVNEVTIFGIFIPAKSCSVQLWSRDALPSTR
jgi:Bacterial regulatory proteins, tetR family